MKKNSVKNFHEKHRSFGSKIQFKTLIVNIVLLEEKFNVEISWKIWIFCNPPISTFLKENSVHDSHRKYRTSGRKTYRLELSLKTESFGSNTRCRMYMTSIEVLEDKFSVILSKNHRVYGKPTQTQIFMTTMELLEGKLSLWIFMMLDAFEINT